MGSGEETVNPPLDSQDEVSGLDLVAEADLFLIAGRTGPLEALMAPGARQGAVRPDKVALAAEVALAQGELDQLAHLDRQDWFGGRCHPPSFGRWRGRGNRIIGAGSDQLQPQMNTDRHRF
jgi:hypothetical protein